jgi:hypothetical protein
MRGVLFLVAIVIVLALIGWISFGRDDNRASINLETQEIREDTQKALDSGAALIERAGDKIDSAVSKSDDSK